MSDDARDADDTEAPPGAGDPGHHRRPRLRSFQPRPTRAADGAHAVPLVREFKGPTVTGLVAASAASINRLPGRVRTVLDAIERDDLVEAHRRLDAVATILPGPGSQRGTRRLWPWFALVWLGALVASVIALCVP